MWSVRRRVSGWSDLPAGVIAQRFDPAAWWGRTPENWAQIGEAAYADDHAAVHEPATVHAMLEDHRARAWGSAGSIIRLGMCCGVPRSSSGLCRTIQICTTTFWPSGSRGHRACGATAWGLTGEGTGIRPWPPDHHSICFENRAGSAGRLVRSGQLHRSWTCGTRCAAPNSPGLAWSPC